MSGIKVTSEELQTLSGQVGTGSTQIQDELGRLHSQVGAVLGGSWEGQAAGKFQALYDEWGRSAAGLKDALDGISRLLANAATTYQTGEDHIASSFNN